MISVCMASFNGAEYIKEQVDSILSQLSENDELIISDDGSTDQTLNIIQTYTDKRIKLLINENTPGYSGNFENALRSSIGDIIFLTDQDDVWLPNKVEFFLSELENCDFVVSDAVIVNSTLEVINDSYFKFRRTSTGFINNLVRCGYLGCCYAFRRKVVLKSLPFPTNHKLMPHDLWLALVAEAYFNSKLLNIPLIKYRRHEHNVSTGGGASTNSFFVKVKIRLYALIQLIKVM
jgi:glycosyltransferase involved in cell wall biosynthesis